MRTPEHVQRRKLRYKSNRTMTSLPILFALLRLILCKSITDFRVSHGKEVLNMATDDFEHVVLVIRLVERQKTVYVETCTGMKVHRKQLLGEELAKHELPDGKKAFARYVLTAAHCVTEDPEKTLKEGPLLNQELFVITLLPKIQSPKIELNGGKIKLTFDKKVAGHISKVLWVAQQGPDRDIAILKLDTELRTTVFNIQFDKTSITEEKTDCRFAGYGVDENGKDSNDIHKLIKVDPADMKLLPSNKCLSDYTTRIMNSNVKISNEAQQCALELTRIAYNSKDPELLCTRHQKGSSPCSGDSGGPLLCETVVGGKTVETVWGLFQQNGNVAIKKQPNCQGKCCNCNDKNGKTCEKELKEYVQSPSPCATQGSTRLDLHARYVNLANPATTRFLKVCVKHLQNIDRLNTKDKKEAEEFCKVKVNKKIANIAFQMIFGTRLRPAPMASDSRQLRYDCEVKDTLKEMDFQHYKKARKWEILDNNSTTLHVLPYSAKDLTMSGFDLDPDHDYRVHDIVFHWGATDETGSEHRFGHEQRPLEIQIRHDVVKHNGASESFRHQAILALTYKICEQDNEGIQKILNVAKDHGLDGDSTVIETKSGFQLEDLIHHLELKDLEKYYLYEGSETTPPCSEDVTWIVMAIPQCVSKKQLQTLRDLKFKRIGEEGNFRAPQKKYNRKIYAKSHAVCDLLTKRDDVETEETTEEPDEDESDDDDVARRSGVAALMGSAIGWVVAVLGYNAI